MFPLDLIKKLINICCHGQQGNTLFENIVQFLTKVKLREPFLKILSPLLQLLL